jgi:putative ABC transport system permease protein
MRDARQLRGWVARLTGLFGREARDRELAEELEAHLQLHVDDLVQSGVDPREARRLALIQLGGMVQTSEECRRRMGIPALEDLWQDLRYGARALRKNSGFTLIAVASLALAIGANSAVFSVVNAVLLRPLPYREPDQLMKVLTTSSGQERSQPGALWSYPGFKALRDQNEIFEGVAAYARRAFNLTGTDEPERLQGEYVSANYFSLLGVGTSAGRAFLPEEDETPGSHQVVMISHALWQRRFGGDPGVVGQVIELEGHKLTVVGVLPKGFKGQSGVAEVWLPMMMASALMTPQLISQSNITWAEVIARLKPGMSIRQAQAALEGLQERIEKNLPGPQVRPSGSVKETFTLVPLKDANVDPMIRRSFLILLAAVAFILLIACANTAGLLLARGLMRRKEFAVRLALGASRGRLMRQLLVESMLVAVLGGAAGLAVALWGVDLMTRFKPSDATTFWTAYARTFQQYTVGIDAVVLAFNFTLSVLTGLLFGLMPAWQASHADVNDALKEGGSGSQVGLGHGLGARRWLIVAEMALSLVLLAGAGLMINSLVRVNSAQLGFEPRGVLTMRVQSRRAGVDFYKQLLERTAAMPGVESVSAAMTAPLFGRGISAPLSLEGEATGQRSASRQVNLNIISPDYFKTLGITLISGRGFTEQDRAGSGRVALVSRAAAGFWAGQDPVGKRIKLAYSTGDQKPDDLIEIVGVVEDVKYGRVEDLAEPAIYLSYMQHDESPSLLIVRTGGDHGPLVSAVRREVYALDRNTPVYGVKSMAERAAEATSRVRFIALLLAIFAGVAVALSAVGIYGVMSYMVAQRTREIGIRMALGARGRDVLRLIVGQGMLLALVGVGLGLAAAFALTRVIRGMLYEVSATDPATFLIVSALLVIVALISCLIPARRATKVDPLIALRSE